MKTWDELSRTQKILVGMLIGTILISIPESAFLLDVGGIELVLFILVMYSQNIKMWYNLHFGMIRYPMIETQAYVKSISLSSVLFFITSSLVFSSGFFLLMMLLRKG